MLKTIVFALIALLVVYSSIHILTPKYPPLNKNLSIIELNKLLKDTLKHEIRNQRYAAEMDSSNRRSLIPVEYIKATNAFATKADSCKNDKDCLIGAYNEFMGKHVSRITRIQTRSFYMISKFGIVGEMLNENLRDLY